MCACCSFAFHSFLFLSFILFRSNANDESHEYLAPVNDENTNVDGDPTGLVVGSDVENPKEIQEGWDRFEKGRVAIDEPLVVVKLGTEENPKNLMIGGGLLDEQSKELT